MHIKIKEYKNCDIFTIETEDQTNIFKKSYGLLEHNDIPPLHGINNLGWKYQHAYVICSDEKIEVGDWYLYFMMDTPDLMKCQDQEEADRCNFHWSIKHISHKIIASTNKSLTIGINNCDGCLANKPLEKGYLHRMGNDTYPDYMGCQKHKYIHNLAMPQDSLLSTYVLSNNNKLTTVMKYTIEIHEKHLSNGSIESICLLKK